MANAVNAVASGTSPQDAVEAATEAIKAAADSL